MSSFFKQLFPFMKVKKKKEFSYIIRGVDPNTIWSLVGELGDGSFGKVYKVRLKCIFTINLSRCCTENSNEILFDLTWFSFEFVS